MKMLKKAGALAIAGAMAMSLGTISAFAEGETSLKPIVVDEIQINELLDTNGEKTGVLKVTVPYTVNASGVDQVTLLAEFGSTETFATQIAYPTTAYIDQKADNSQAFTFKIDENRLIPEGTTNDVYLNVKVGGTGVTEVGEGHVKAHTYVKPEEPQAPITNAMIADALMVDSSNAVLKNLYGSGADVAVMKLDADLITAKTIDLEKEIVTIDGNPAMYTEYNDEKVLVAFVDLSKSEHTVETTPITDETKYGSQKLRYGDSNLDAFIDVVDISNVLIKMYDADLMGGTLSDYSFIASDPNGDKFVDVVDISYILQLMYDLDMTPEAAK